MNIKKTSKTKAIVAGIALYLTAGSAAMAACSSTTCSGTISRLFINQGGVLSIRLNDTDISDSSCTATNNYGTLQPDNAGFKNFYAMALTALAAGNPVSLRMVDNSPTCSIQYIVIDQE